MQPRSVRYRILIERLYNRRRITLLREEADEGYNLCFVTCLSPIDVAECLATADGKVLELRRAVSWLPPWPLSGDAVQALCTLFQYHEYAAEHRRLAPRTASSKPFWSG